MSTSSSCRPLTYFDTPEFLTRAAHSISIIAIPIYILGFYCILFKSPARAKSFKWCMFISISWSVVQDISVTILTIPFVLLPEWAGYPLGVLTEYFGIDPAVQTFFVAFIIVGMGTSVVCSIENRYHQIKKLKMSQATVQIALYSLNGCTAIYSLFMILHYAPNQELSRFAVFAALPCLPQYVLDMPIFVASIQGWKTLLYMMGLVLLIGGQLFFFFLSTFYHLYMISSNIISSTTRKYQKTVFIGVSIQNSIPIASIVIPFVYFGFSSKTAYYNQFYNNLVYLLFSCHGILSVVALLFLQKSFRTFIISKFTCFGSKSTESNTTITTTTESRSKNVRSKSLHV